MTQTGDDWKANAAAALKLLKDYYESLDEATLVAFALKNALIECELALQPRFEKHYKAPAEGESAELFI